MVPPVNPVNAPGLINTGLFGESRGEDDVAPLQR